MVIVGCVVVGGIVGAALGSRALSGGWRVRSHASWLASGVGISVGGTIGLLAGAVVGLLVAG